MTIEQLNAEIKSQSLSKEASLVLLEILGKVNDYRVKQRFR